MPISNPLTLSDTVPVTQAEGDIADAGNAIEASRQDHRHGMPSEYTPSDHDKTKHTDYDVVVKIADEIVNNSDILQNDDHLYFSAGANEIWQIDAYFVTTATPTADIKLAFTVPTGGAIYFQGATERDEIDATLAIGKSQSGAKRFFLWRFRYEGGATAGTVQLQWAQLVAEVSDCIVHKYSHFVLRQLA